MKKRKYSLLLISVALLFSCGSRGTKDGEVKEKRDIIKDGIVKASIFKKNEKEYYIWTQKEVKSTNEADSMRFELELCEDKIMYFFSDSTLDDGRYYALFKNILLNNPQQSFSGKLKGNAYIENNDTIMLLYYENGNICNMYSSIVLQNKDIPFLNRALKYFSVNSKNTIFLFADKNKIGENYYASYNGSSIHKKVRKEQLVNNIISEIQSGMVISNKGNILAFLAKIEKAEKGIFSMPESAKSKANNALLAFQKKHFPMARKAYYKNAKDELWEKNIEVSMSGRDITFTGYMFVDNKVKKDTYLEIKDELTNLRFKSVGFRAFDGDDRTYWDLDSKKDSDI